MSTFYLFCALVGGFLVLSQLVFGAFDVEGGHHDVDMDTDVDHDKPGLSGLNLFSLRALAAGFMMFGVTGGLLVSMNVGQWTAFLSALAVGIVFNVSMAYLMKQMVKLEQDGSIEFANIVGATGTVYVPMAPGDGGVVIVQINDREIPMTAVNKTSVTLDTNRLVKVTEVHNDVVYVENI